METIALYILVFDVGEVRNNRISESHTSARFQDRHKLNMLPLMMCWLSQGAMERVDITQD